MAKQKVTLEVLSYHATAPREESQRLMVSVLLVNLYNCVFCTLNLFVSLSSSVSCKNSPYAKWSKAQTLPRKDTTGRLVKKKSITYILDR